MTKVLVIDNSEFVLESLKEPIENDGHHVFTAQSGQAGLKVAWQHSPDLVILNLIMPTMDGYETCRRLRELGVPSILATSDRYDERSIVKALEMGADDCLRQPLDVPILLAKIRTLMRRNNPQTAANIAKYDDGQLLIDLEIRHVQKRGQGVKLTPTEFRLLAILLRRMGRVVTHEELIREIWGTDKSDGLGSLKLYIHYLRQKLEDNPKRPYYLLAEWGIGYRFKELKAELV